MSWIGVFLRFKETLVRGFVCNVTMGSGIFWGILESKAGIFEYLTKVECP